MTYTVFLKLKHLEKTFSKGVSIEMDQRSIYTPGKRKTKVEKYVLHTV